MLSANQIEDIKCQAYKCLPSQFNNICKIYPVPVIEILEMGINAYNGIIKQIGAAEAEIAAIKDNANEAERLNQIFEKSFGKNTAVQLDTLQDKFREIKDTMSGLSGGEIFKLGNGSQESNDIFFGLQNQFNDFTKNLGDLGREIPGLQNLSKIFNEIKDPAKLTTDQLRDLRTQLNNVINEAGKKIGLISQVEDLNNSLRQGEANLKQANLAKQQFLDTTKTEAQIKNFINLTSAVGRLASGFMAISNLSKVWHNESLSGGQKLLQIFTNLGFVIPMIETALVTIRKSLGLQVGLGTLLAALAERTAIAKEKQAIQQKKITAEKAKQALEEKFQKTGNKTGFQSAQYNRLTEEIKGYDKALDDLNSKNTGLVEKIKKDWSTATTGIGNFFNSALTFFSSSAGAITATVGAAVALAAGIGVLTYQVWNKAENDSKKATETADQAKAHYSEVRKELSDLRSGFDNLHSAQDTFAGLTKGTNEWHSALENVNSQVLELCDKFPELAQYLYTTSDGMLSFRDGAEQLVLEKSQQNAQAAGATYVAQQRKATEAQNEASMVQASRDLGLGNWDTSLIHYIK